MVIINSNNIKQEKNDDIIEKKDNKELTFDEKLAMMSDEEIKVLSDMDFIINKATKKRDELVDSVKFLNKPRKVKKVFLREQKLIPKLMAKLKRNPLPLQKELQEPLLFLMKENGYTDIIEGVKAGEFTIATPKGEKTIVLSPDKFTTLKYGEQYYKCWIAYENSMSPYPENPIHNAEMYRKTTQKLAMNWRDRDEAMLITAKTKMWIYIIGAVTIGLVLLFSTDFGSNLINGLMNKGSGEVAKQVVTTAAKNITKVTPSTGGITIQ